MAELPEPRLGREDLYVHAADDGGIFAVGADRQRSAWVTLADLVARLEAVRHRGGEVWLSTERGSPVAAAVIRRVEEAGAAVPRCTPLTETRRAEGITALMSAAYTGAAGLLDDLLARGVPVDARDEKGYTALVFAADGGQPEMARRLLAAGADLGATDDAGNTALSMAAWRGHEDVARLLLDAGADPTHRRADGLAPRDLAEGRGHRCVAALFHTPAAAGVRDPLARPPAGLPPGASATAVVLPALYGRLLLAIIVVLAAVLVAIGVAASGWPGLAVAAGVAAVALALGAAGRRLYDRQALVVDGTRLWLRRLRWSSPVDLAEVVEVRWSDGRGGAYLGLRHTTGGTHPRWFTIPLTAFGERAVLALVSGPLLRDQRITMSAGTRRHLQGRS